MGKTVTKPYKSTGVKYRSEEWYEKHRKGIGGSDAAGISGFTPYSSALAVYTDKVGTREAIEESEAMRQGADLEDYVVQRFCDKTGKKVKKNGFMLQSIAHPFMLADVDRFIVGENAILECKCTLNRDNYSYEDANFIPAYYLVQCLHYMAVVGADKCYLAALVYGRDFYVIEINRADYEEDIEALIAMEERFWNGNVKAGVPPVPDGSDSSAEVLASLYPNANEELAPIDISRLTPQLNRLSELKREIEALDGEKKGIENLIKQQLGEAPVGECDGYRVTWKNRSSVRLDTKALKTELPDVYAQYAKTSTTRTFLFTVKD